MHILHYLSRAKKSSIMFLIEQTDGPSFEKKMFTFNIRDIFYG